MPDIDQAFAEYERLLELETRAANSRQDLRDRVQDKSLEQADGLMGLATHQQAIHLARGIARDPN